MKQVAVVNTQIPTLDSSIIYSSDNSLSDFDIIVIDPKFPYKRRIEFSGGGSCVDIDGAAELQTNLAHWRSEIRLALQAGKTIFVLLNRFEVESIATSCQTVKGAKQYSTSNINNYSILPTVVDLNNSTGSQIIVTDPRFKSLYKAVASISEYKVRFNTNKGKITFTNKDGNCLGEVLAFKELPGRIVMLPYFSFAELIKYDAESEENHWDKKALGISAELVKQLIEVDKVLRSASLSTPAPSWLDSQALPNRVTEISSEIVAIDAQIQDLENDKTEKSTERSDLMLFSQLLYEQGDNLEKAIEESLKLFGFSVENFRDGDLEIDHIIIGPDGFRMIGESEGKDNSAVDISKFRQLETNINEDFQREDIESPAKGVLFGNGFRLIQPESRAEQFTTKCLTNAKRLNTALVRTSDLYVAVLHSLNNPADEEFKALCRESIQNAAGEIVIFPVPNSQV